MAPPQQRRCTAQPSASARMGRSHRDECRSSTRTNRINWCDIACSDSLGVYDTRRARRAAAPRCCTSSSSERRVVAATA
eukprot:8590974-Pyramimonas_sp.AAC.1